MRVCHGGVTLMVPEIWNVETETYTEPDGIGFTVSMFIADLSYAGLGASGVALLNQAKLGVLCGSVVSAILGCLLLNKFLPKAD